MIKQVQRNGLLNDFMLGEEMVFISIWMILGCASENIEVENNYDSEVHDNWLAEEADNRELIALSPNSKISGGVNFDCALEGNGSILCWGKNDYGQVSQAPDHSIIGFQEILPHHIRPQHLVPLLVPQLLCPLRYLRLYHHRQ